MKKILIVEDDIDIITVIKLSLEDAGYAVSTAYDGMEAVEKVETDKPDLILLDLMLPKMDGHGVNKKLKADASTRNIPVIVMTGKGHYQDLVQAQGEMAVNAYFEKPFPIKVLIEKIKSFIG